MNRQQLASKIWQSANKMRSKIEANEYKDYILGFIFYKFLSEKEEKYLAKEGWSESDLPELKEDNTVVVSTCQKNLGYFIAYENLFSRWLGKGKDFDVSNVTDGINAFIRLIDKDHEKLYGKIFDTLNTGLSKLGDSSSARTKAISDLIHLIDDIPMDGKQGYDVLGFIYEYLISMFAANAGKKAGEFYTPHEVSLLMSEIVAHHLRNKKQISIYDPTSGSGSLLINIGKSISKHIGDKNSIKYYAQELKENTFNLTRMNLVMRGILPANIITRNADTLKDDWPYFDDADPSKTYAPLYVDAVVSNPPYSQHWDSTDMEQDPRYSRFGIAPKTKADYAFLLHDLYHVKPDGIMTIILPHGVLFRGGEEGNIRKNLIENNHIDVIIGLPANVFFGTGIPTIIMVLRQSRSNTDTLFIDASKGFIKVGKNNKLQASDIKKIVDTVIQRKDVDKLSRVVSRDEIRKNDYNLNIPRYVDSSEKAESWDIYATIFGGVPNSEIDELNEYWEAFPNLRSFIFKSDETPYSLLITQHINQVVHEHEDFKHYRMKFDSAFENFSQYLESVLITNIEKVDRSRVEQDISDNLFDRIKDIPLIDKYKAYQILDDQWSQIEIDLEIIQTEGLESINKVDPRMEMKKKGDIEEEVQVGLQGRILPFDLVQNRYFTDEARELQSIESKLASIDTDYQELFDSLTEEELEGTYVNEDKTAFAPAEVKKYIKSLSKSTKYPEESLEYRLIKINNLVEEEKGLKKNQKEKQKLLEDLTKNKIESLTIEQGIELVKIKWVDPIVQSIFHMPVSIVNEFEVKVKNLVSKYSTTLLDIESQLVETVQTLAPMLDELVGDEFDLRGLVELKSILLGE
jgi:type I restriction enzyme M protein